METREEKKARERAERVEGGKKAKKAFEGLTRKPVCELCEVEAERQERETKREPPPKIKRERGRRQEVDTSKHFCPEDECPYHG